MKNISSIGLILMMLLSTSGFAESRSQATVEKELAKAVQVSVGAYSSGGMVALVQKVEGCYQKPKGSQFYCLYLDLASRHIDQMFAAAMNFPPTAYFADDVFMPRIIPVLVGAKMDYAQANGYLAMVSPIINKLVDQQLAKQ
ncbi:MAG: hypothetical protein PHP57_13760 [Sideroxydans sp.]|nr:hypothetical protein [Sideroxydans sp.]